MTIVTANRRNSAAGSRIITNRPGPRFRYLVAPGAKIHFGIAARRELLRSRPLIAASSDILIAWTDHAERARRTSEVVEDGQAR